VGISLFRDCYVTSAIQCYTEKKVKGMAIRACYAKVQANIDKLKPKVIITFGKEAIDAVIHHKLTGRISGTAWNDWIGYTIPEQEYKCFICPTWDNTSLLTDRDGINPVIRRQMLSNIKAAVACSDKEFPIYDFAKDIKPIKNKNDAIDTIKRAIRRWKYIAVDYETTGIKPYMEGHEIVTAAISDGKIGYAFPFFNDKDFRAAWKELLQAPNIGKIFHNAKYEYLWTLNRAGNNNNGGYEIKNIAGDTMLDAHIINNKKAVGLKFLVYAHFGIAGYDNVIDEYLSASPEDVTKFGANAINRIKEADINAVLEYNGYDPFFTYKIWEIQQKQLIPELTAIGSKFFRESSIELAKAENKGVVINGAKALLEYDAIDIKMNDLTTTVLASKAMKKWDKEKPFRLSAPGDLTHLLFDCMGYKTSNKTATGKYKADVEALEKIDIPVVKCTLQWRKLKKIRDTYLHGFMKEAVNGIIHTSLNLHTVDTFRSSSNDPNLQNVPVRDVETMLLLRKLIISRRGHKLGEYDYKAMEAAIVACYNKDPRWIAYVSDIDNDMHRDMAAKTFLRKKEEVLKAERQCTKTFFVFPTIYGSYWKNTAMGMWENCGEESRQHLKSKGISTLDDYREHVKMVEKWFWEDQFPVGYEWMQKTIFDYEKKGYIDLLTGFRCYGPMSRNQIINFRVQGTASNCKLWTLKNVSRVMEEKKMDTKILLEIHDSIIPDINPAEEGTVDHLMWLYGTQKIRDWADWLTVPLFLEKKISEVDGNWAEMKTVGLLKG
jgi:DNA polymerase I-like protein with 3'-5' exonuclease and polymerase domains